MDTLGIIEKEGYRREDLNQENQTALYWMDCLIEDLDNLKNNLGFIDEEMEFPETIIAKIKNEIAVGVIDKAVEWCKIQEAEIQIGMAENETEEE